MLIGLGLLLIGQPLQLNIAKELSPDTIAVADLHSDRLFWHTSLLAERTKSVQVAEFGNKNFPMKIT